jgi:hypothetical protein
MKREERRIKKREMSRVVDASQGSCGGGWKEEVNGSQFDKGRTKFPSPPGAFPPSLICE